MKTHNLKAFAAAAALAVAVAGAAHAGDYKDKKEAKLSIYETAKEAGFKTLVAAVDAAGLAETLKGKGTFTVFAPTDEAFAKLPEGALEKLLADKEALKSVLLYHVVDGKVTSKDVAKISEAKALSGKMLTVNAGDGVKINNATVVKADVYASNGVIHVIDTVLLPSKASGEGASH